MVDDLSVSEPPVFDGFLVKSFPSYLWFWFKFWFLIVCNVWFIYFFIWFLYWLFSLTNSSLILRNVLLALGTFILISLFIGMVMYNVRLSGVCLPDDRVKNFNHIIANSYPLHGMSKLVVRFVDKDLFYSIAGWSNSDFGKIIVNIPDPIPILNVSNSSNVSNS
jgi:hypothetical protein